jgi:hypothetical protein
VRTGTVFDNVGRRYSQGERWPTTVVTSRLGCTTSRFEHGRLDDTWVCVEQVCILVVNILTMSKMANSDASLRHAISLMSLSACQYFASFRPLESILKCHQKYCLPCTVQSMSYGAVAIAARWECPEKVADLLARAAARAQCCAGCF